MLRTRAFGYVALFVTTALIAGCGRRTATIADAFPRAAMAAPWVLAREVWNGSFAEAEAALGPDADPWRMFGPQRVWLAVYRHEYEPHKKLTLRAFAFESRERAREAYTYFRPLGGSDFKAGDAGCWTEVGVLFVWGRLVFEIFGWEGSWPSQVQAAVLAAFVQKHMPPGLPDEPL